MYILKIKNERELIKYRMIGFQEYIIINNISVSKLADELEIDTSTIHWWIRRNKVSKKYIKILCEKFKVEEGYINKKVNDINLSKPRKKPFNKYIIDGKITTIYIETKDSHAEGKILELLIDTDKLSLLQSYDRPVQVMWNNNTKSFYARFYIYDSYDENKKVKYKTLYIQRLIADAKEDDYVDHINYNSLDNRLENLRVTKNHLNLRHRKDANSNNRTGHRNICWIEKEQCYYVQLTIDGNNVRLGKFNINQLEEAVSFANKMREKYYGEFKGEREII